MESLVTQHDLQSSYKNKKVFVTGHTGFKGAWLTTVLNDLGAIVKGYSLEPQYKNSIYHITHEYCNINSVIQDIRNQKELIKEVTDFNPDFIFHLAAQPLVTYSYEKPTETFDINVIGTSNLLEAVMHLKSKCTVIIITTDKVYENKEQHILYKEEDTLGGYDPYSASKACTELVVNSFRNSFFNVSKYNDHLKCIATARAGNVIGGGDWNDNRIIPDIVRALSENKTVEVRNPNAVRPWQHVLEPIFGYLLLGGLLDKNCIKYSKAYNFGPFPEDHLTVKTLVENSIKIWQSGSWKNISNPNQVHEANLLQLDINKAMNELNWKPKLTASQAIEWTIDWYKKSDAEKLDFTLNQIKRFLQL